MIEVFNTRATKALNAQVTGTTKLIGIIGTPVAQLKSPEVWNALFESRDVDAVFLPLDVSAENLDAAIAGLKALDNLTGLMVTMPHKFAAAHHVDRLSSQSRHGGAISMMRREDDGAWAGDSCEAGAVLAALRETGFEPRDASVFIVGAGGAGQVIAWALALAGAVSIAVHDVDRPRAEDLCRRISAATDCSAFWRGNDPSGFELVINATPVGMSAKDPFPTDVEAINGRALVLDMIADPSPTRFLARASARGCRTIEGLRILRATVPVFAKFLGLGDGW
jgi:shikimate dehydrogenase